uniref:Uncharacterized protein n=1 Tax=Lepeophtheirus salmonis TaxID=72036 RepID=A0A0K2UDQ9_LEPSM
MLMFVRQSMNPLRIIHHDSCLMIL